MLMDRNLVLCNKLAITSAASTATTEVGDTIDFYQEFPDIGQGTPLYLHFIVTTGFVTSGAGDNDTWDFQLYTGSQISAQKNLDANNGTRVNLLGLPAGAQAKAYYTKGQRLVVPIPIIATGTRPQRYCRLRIVGRRDRLTAAAISAFINHEQAVSRIYAEGQN